MLTMPLIVYPTLILWVDDDTLFLQSVSHAFKKRYSLKTYNSPAEALCFLQSYKPHISQASFFSGCNHHEEYDLHSHLPVDIDLKAIAALHEHPQRLNDIAVMIVDYNMPEMTGIELCRELKHLPIKKILLTGETEHAEAVSAFNEGIIHCFLRKDDPQLSNNLLLYIDNLTRQYFNEISKPLLAHLQADYQLPQSDLKFITFFNQWCKVNQIKEYYLIDKNGSLLVINDKGEQRYFIIHSDRTLNAFVDLYHDADEVSQCVNLVKQRDKIFFFGLGNDPWDLNMDEWARNLYTPQLLQGREQYYWVVVGNCSPVDVSENLLNV